MNCRTGANRPDGVYAIHFCTAHSKGILFLSNFATEYLREKKITVFSFPGDYFSYLCTDIGEGQKRNKSGDTLL